MYFGFFAALNPGIFIYDETTGKLECALYSLHCMSGTKALLSRSPQWLNYISIFYSTFVMVCTPGCRNKMKLILNPPMHRT
jgi:hypothetical protein